MNAVSFTQFLLVSYVTSELAVNLSISKLSGMHVQ